MFTYKDQLIRYMTAGHVHLSKKDFGFFANLVLAIQSKGQITSNQSKLVDKLLQKYQRQLKKCNLDPESLIKLDWNTKVVESKKEYLQAHLFCQDGKLYLTCPFNNSFIKYFRNIDPNPFVWNKENRCYVTEYSTYSFKIAYQGIVKFFTDVVLDEGLSKTKEYVDQFSNTIFDPTLVRCGDNFYICAINETLLEALNDTRLDDSPECLYKLSQLGIKIHDNLVNGDHLKLLASNYHCIFDASKLDVLARYLKQIGINKVITGRGLAYSKDITKELTKELRENDISIHPFSKQPTEDMILLNLHSHNDHGYNKYITKIITLANSSPVQVK